MSERDQALADGALWSPFLALLLIAALCAVPALARAARTSHRRRRDVVTRNTNPTDRSARP